MFACFEDREWYKEGSMGVGSEGGGEGNSVERDRSGRQRESNGQKVGRDRKSGETHNKEEVGRGRIWREEEKNQKKRGRNG